MAQPVFRFPERRGNRHDFPRNPPRQPQPTPLKALASDCLQYATIIYQDRTYFEKCVRIAATLQLPESIKSPPGLLSCVGNWDPFVFTDHQLDSPTDEHVTALRKFTHVSYYVDNGIPMLAGIYYEGSDDQKSKPVLVIAFRGTSALHELLYTDSDVLLENAEINRDGGIPQEAQAHGGFVRYLIHLRRLLMDVLNDTHTDDSFPTRCKEMPVLFTGHSLGGAVSMLAAYNTVRGNFNADESGSSTRPPLGVGCITFGCPRVGNEAFCTQITTQEEEMKMGLLLCFEAGRDPVVKLPLGISDLPRDLTIYVIHFGCVPLGFSDLPHREEYVIHLGYGPDEPEFPRCYCLPDHFSKFYEELMERNDTNLRSSRVGQFRDMARWNGLASLWPVQFAWDEAKHGELSSLYKLGVDSLVHGTAGTKFLVRNLPGRNLYNTEIQPILHYFQHPLQYFRNPLQNFPRGLW